MLVSSEMTTLGQSIYHKDPSKPIKYNYGLAVSEIVVYTVVIALVPVALLTIGIIVKVKRKYL